MPVEPKRIKRPWVKDVKPHKRFVDNSYFYNSWAWRKKRKQYLNKNPLCVVCDEKGIITNATVVDHILPISLGGCKLCDDNLQAMCEHHHNQKSGKEAHGFVQK